VSARIIENQALVLDLIEWLAAGDRSYDEVMAAWRTSCPRLPVWEDANDLGFVARIVTDGCVLVRATDSGRVFLNEARPSSVNADSRSVRSG
jgi:D-3-phosphoglycerate dehydrogenase